MTGDVQRETAALRDDGGPVATAKMPALLYGSLCTGIGGLDLAVEAHFGALAAWHSEVEPAPCTVIERHWPGVPNLGDLTALDWADVPPVDVLTAGYPCQPFSHAGKRKGSKDARHLWPHIIDGVRHLRPRWVVLENVRGHLSLGFDAVLGSLAEAGFDAEWCVLRASDVGACHQRARIFVVATDSEHDGRHGPSLGRGAGQSQDERGLLEPQGRAATAAPHPGGERHGGGQDGRAVGRVDGRHEGQARERQRAWTQPVDRGPALVADTGGQRLDGNARLEGDGRDEAERGEASGDAGDGATSWGQYEPAIRRWEFVIGRAAPAPTEGTQLAPRFVEWMMGYPAGWVDGLTRTQALKALGNAVVPQQALAACDELAPITTLAGAVA